MRARGPSVGEFGTTRIWDEIGSRLAALMGDEHVKVGVFGDATKAAAHEFGSEDGEHPPKRSFIRKTFEEEAFGELKDTTARLAKSVIVGKTSGKQALGLLGEWGAARVKKTIRDQPDDWKDLADSTKERKGPKKTQILIDTGELINSITYEVMA